MTIRDLNLGQTFTATGYDDWGVMKLEGFQGNVALISLTDATKRAWLPNPNLPIWLPDSLEVTLV